MTSPCNHPTEVVGPFPQTLFMGCSIQKFNLNLGWGREPSTCTINLVVDPTAHPNDSSYNNKTSFIETKLSSDTDTISSTTLDTENDVIEENRNLHRNILTKLQDQESARRTNDIDNISLFNRKDNGKKIWTFGQTVAYNHTLRDPGFLADDFGILGNNVTRRNDILGSLSHFRFDNTIFNGVVKTWNFNNGLIEVQLQSPTNLVKNTKLIINNYNGTISTAILGTSMAGGGGQIAVPFDDPTIDPNNAYTQSSIYQGNIPNLINVLGFAGFANLGYAEDRGVSLGAVYDYVKIMLASNSTSNRFNPYKGIVAKAVRNRIEGGFLDWTNSLQGSNLYLDKYSTMQSVMANDNIMRPILDFDISEVPRPHNGVYISDSSISLLDFVDKCCEPVGMDYYFELLPSSAAPGIRTACVKVRTISRRFQPSLDSVRGMVTSFSNNDFVTDFKFGQEFQDAKTRTVILGGKQQRLFQANTETVGHYRHRRVFEPGKNSFVDFSKIRTDRNYFREPDTARYRNLLPGRKFYTGPVGNEGAVVAQPDVDGGSNFNFIESSPFSEQEFLRGSYLPLTQFLGDGSSATSSIYFNGQNDIIKPYYGKDMNGDHRAVSFRKTTGETFFNVNGSDLAALFPANDAPNFTGSIDVSETEIRCAMAGPDSWLNYIFEMPVLGKPVGMSTYIYNYMSQKFGGPFATNFFMNALNIFSSDKGKLSALPAVSTASPINIENYLPYSESLWPALSALHAFFADIGNENYGRKFLVQLPNISSYVDGNGVRRYAYEVTDKAWEEPGNFIDDTMQIGSPVANSLANEDGTFGPIVGFDASAEYDSVFVDDMQDSFMNPAGNAQFIIQTSKKSPLSWYWPLMHNIPREDVYYMPFFQQVVPQALLPEGTKIINPVYPENMSAHGESPPGDGYKWKMYTRASLEDVYPQAQYNSKLTVYYGNPHCIISTASPVFVDSPTQLLKTMMEEMLINDGKFSGGSMVGGSKSSFAYLLAWTIAEKGLRQGGTFLSPPMGNQQNLPIAPRAAIPIFAAIPLKSNFSCYGPWSSHPGLGFEGDRNLFNDNFPVHQINNLVGEVNFEHDESAVPWNYGGIHAMDDSILVKLKDSNQYQQVLENGTITTAGIMFLGSNLGGTLVANGPLVNSVSINIGDNGMTTNYSMRTYNKKMGFYNKDTSENIQRVNRQAIETRQQISAAVKEMVSKASNKQSNIFSRPLPKGLSFSPVSVLAGSAKPYLNGESTLTDVYEELDYDPSWAMRPSVGDGTISPKEYPMQKSIAMLYDEQEMSDLLTSEFNRRSFMSLDGILSPISFYPTKYVSTYSMTLYDRAVCPYCEGDGSYEYIEFKAPPDSEDSEPGTVPGGTTDETKDLRNNKSKTCPFCTVNSDKGQNRNTKPSLKLPPYILTDTDDDSSYDIDPTTIGMKINKFSLNPIVMTRGEFAITGAKQTGDECGHSIDVVGFGEEPPAGGDSLRPSTSTDINNNFDQDINQRFFGLRGPIMVHGWGYDLDGYPVPNSSGQMKKIPGQEGDFSITQELKPDGTITDPHRTNEFYKGWAQQPGTWPVGPVDLRWDDDAGVWTIGSQYKNVWVTVEVDLVGTQPARGTIFSLNEEDDDALEEGKRRLVFVKDAVGTFAAPRGASIYCQYDSDSGFYTPLYNNSMVTSGTLLGSNSATIYQSYERNYDEDDPTSYTTTFKNPLKLNVDIDAVGLFGYINGSWVLQNVK
jgi:hypothetical protein